MSAFSKAVGAATANLANKQAPNQTQPQIQGGTGNPLGIAAVLLQGAQGKASGFYCRCGGGIAFGIPICIAAANDHSNVSIGRRGVSSRERSRSRNEDSSQSRFLGTDLPSNL